MSADTSAAMPGTRNATLADMVTILKSQRARRLDVVAPAAAIHAHEGNLVISGTVQQLTAEGVTSAAGTYRPTNSKDPGTALRLHAREELGVDLDELPSPVLAGAASLVAFSVGALVPLLPYLLGAPVLAASLAITAVTLVCGGMVVGRLTGRPVLSSGLRQLALGGLAVAITYGVGTLIGHHAG